MHETIKTMRRQKDQADNMRTLGQALLDMCERQCRIILNDFSDHYHFAIVFQDYCDRRDDSTKSPATVISSSTGMCIKGLIEALKKTIAEMEQKIELSDKCNHCTGFDCEE